VKTDIHFITVSRAGELMARRKGGAPVCVATITTGLDVQTDEASRMKGVPSLVRVRFGPGGANRLLRVDAIEVDGAVIEVNAFLARFEVSDADLGKWIRVRVEQALDAAAKP
jgi:hypothetical protein